MREWTEKQRAFQLLEYAGDKLEDLNTFCNLWMEKKLEHFYLLRKI